jgi:ATP-dependent 26S proteasome regulatory subunit
MEIDRLTDEPIPIECDRSYHIKEFADALYGVLGVGKQQDLDIQEFLECNSQEYITSNIRYKKYKEKQILVAFKKFLNDHNIERITDYDDETGKIKRPMLEELEVKRGIHDRVIISAFIFMKYKECKLVVNVYPSRYNLYFVLYIHEDNIDMLSEFKAELDHYILQYNPFLGEKVMLVDGYGEIDFLQYPRLTWDDIVLSEDVMSEVDMNILYPLEHQQECIEEGVPWRRGLLLTGVPGTGKTLLTKVLCNVLASSVLIVTSKSLSGSPESISMAFEIARYLSPCLLVFEDLDLIGRERTVANDPMLCELLNQLDGVSERDGVFVMASTNRPDLLDSALTQRPARFDGVVELKLPTSEARKELLELYIDSTPYSFDLDDVVLRTKDMTCAQIREVVLYSKILKLSSGKNIVSSDMIRESSGRMNSIMKRLGYIN